MEFRKNKKGERELVIYCGLEDYNKLNEIFGLNNLEENKEPWYMKQIDEAGTENIWEIAKPKLLPKGAITSNRMVMFDVGGVETPNIQHFTQEELKLQKLSTQPLPMTLKFGAPWYHSNVFKEEE